MEQVTIKQETSSTPTIQVTFEFEQLFELVQQLSDEKRIEFLDKLQAELEEAKLILPRMDEKQRQNHVPVQQANRPGYKTPFVTEELIKKWEEEEANEKEEEEELDANLTNEELLEMIKNI